MSTDFVVTAKSNPERFQHNVSIDDAVTFSIDFSPWAEDNSEIDSVTWVSETGQIGISNQALNNGIATALLTFSQSGRSMVSVLATTANEKKKVWLDLRAKDLKWHYDDYGICR